MRSPRTVLVTGATGTVGEQVVAHLQGDSVRVRAGVRDPDAARERFDPAVDLVRFDFTKPETWGPAFESVDRLFLLRPPAISRVERHVTPAVDAAVRCGVEHVAFLSVLGAEKVPVLPHRRVEKHLADSDATYTFLRASFFMQNLVEVHREALLERNELFVPAGDGAISFVDARDVGAVAAVALTDPQHENRAYDLTGPAALGLSAVADALSVVLGRDVTYPNPSVFAFARRAYAEGWRPGYVVTVLAIYAPARFGLAGRVTDDVERVLGRAPTDIREFVAEYADRFTPDAESPESGTDPG